MTAAGVEGAARLATRMAAAAWLLAGSETATAYERDPDDAIIGRGMV
jgi:hypothetical protein